MGMIHIQKSSNYTVVSNECIQDSSLSMKAKGLWIYLMSLPNDWNLHQTELVRHFKDGRDAVSSAMKELEEAGYVIKKQITNSLGQYTDWDYTVFEVVNHADNPRPDTGFPTSGLSNADNPTLQSTNDKQSTKNITKDSKRFIKPSIQEIEKFCKEKDYCVDAVLFFNHYESVGWKVGKSSMKSWKATLVGWNHRNEQRKNPQSKHKVELTTYEKVKNESPETALKFHRQMTDEECVLIGGKDWKKYIE